MTLHHFRHFQFLCVMFFLFANCLKNDKQNYNKKDQQISAVEKDSKAELKQKFDIVFLLDSMCQSEVVKNNGVFGNIKLLNIRQSGRCFCKTSYLQNTKKELFCMDYFLQYQEQINNYNEFIKNNDIKLIDEAFAEQYFILLLSLGKEYFLVRFDNVLKVGDAVKLTGIILRKYARDPFEYVNGTTLLSFSLEIDTIGTLKNVELNIISPKEKRDSLNCKLDR